MTFEEALVSHLTTYPALSTLIGDRVEPVQKTQFSALPAITFIRAGRRTSQHRSSRKANHSRGRFQFDVWGSTYGETIATKAVLFDAMAAFARDSSPRVDVSLLQDDRDAFEAEPGKWRAIVDYHIWHTEA